MARRALLGLAFLALGAVAAVASGFVAMAVVVVVAPALGRGSAVGSTDVVAGVALAGLMIVACGLAPASRRIAAATAEALLGVRGLAEGPASRMWGDRWRCALWVVVHVAAGAALTGVLVVVLPAVGGVSSILAVAAAVAVLALGAVLARALGHLAPALLGPSSRDRVALLERRAREATDHARLAREIHDSVGHALAIVTVHAATARRLQDTDPAYVAEALGVIEAAGRRATAELDHVVGLLRGGAVEEGPTARAATGVHGLSELVADANESGLATELEDRLSDEDRVDLSPVTGRELYRIAQECVANALRHGAAPCRVRLDRTSAHVRLSVRSGIRDGVGAPGRTGSGLRGVAERAEALGGSAVAGRDGEAWEVAVSLPWVGQR